MAPDPIIAEIIETARSIWPDATGFMVSPPTTLCSKELGIKITPWVLTRYIRDCDGDEIALFFTGSSCAALRDKLLEMKGQSDAESAVG